MVVLVVVGLVRIGYDVGVEAQDCLCSPDMLSGEEVVVVCWVTEWTMLEAAAWANDGGDGGSWRW